MATQQFLAKAYLAYFGRPVDPVGAFAFKDATDTQVFQAFYESPESQALYGTGFGEVQITAIYQMLFNRDPEPAGLDYWLNQIEMGFLTPAGAALGILNGARNSDAVAVANKLAASSLFTTSLDTLAEANAYVGDAAAAQARAFLKSVDSLPATQVQVDNIISDLIDINGPGVHGAPNTFTLTEVVESTTVVTTGPVMERVVMWGYNPHAHSETGGVDNLDGNNPDGNDNNLTNEGPEDGGVPIEELYKYIQTIADLDLVQLGLINIANGEDDESTQLFGDVAGMDIVNNGDGTQTISVTLTDGTVNTAEVAISQQFFDLIHGWLFDAEGNSRIYETVRVANPNDTGSSQTVTTYAPIVLTSFENNGGTVERDADGSGPATTPGDDLIVAGRLELLHGAYIDGGAGYNILEVDAKGTYAQPLELTRIQEVRVQNLPNVYTTAYGDGYGYLSNSTYPDLSLESSSSGGSDDSVLDISRAVDIERLVITEGSGTGRYLGELTVVGVRGDAVLRLEGDFTEDVTVNYGQGQTGPLTVELLLGDTSGANLNFVGNADALNLVSMGTANTFDSDVYGGNLVEMNISGTGYLEIGEDLDDWFTDTSPVTIDASANTGGVNLRLTESPNVTFLGSMGDDIFIVETSEAYQLINTTDDDSVTIVDGGGNNHFQVETDILNVTLLDGNNKLEVEDAESITVMGGDGDNHFQFYDGSQSTIVLGDGNNRMEIDAQGFSDEGVVEESINFPNETNITVGDGQNVIDVVADSDIGVAIIVAGNGGNEVNIEAATISVTAGTGADDIRVEGRDITVNAGGTGNSITVVGTDNDYTDGNSGALIKIAAGTDSVVNLGSGTDPQSAEGDDFPGTGTLIAKMGSSITGTNLTLVVDTVADLRAATLSGITKIILDDDNFNYHISDTANAGSDKALLTLTSAQVTQLVTAGVDISVEGSIFNTSAHIKIIVTSSLDMTTGAWATWLSSLPVSVDLMFEINDGATLKLTAQQLHTKVTAGGISTTDDGNTDAVSGKVYITGAGLDFDPFNNSDQVRTTIDSREYIGGSLSTDVDFGFATDGDTPANGIQRDEWGFNVLLDRVITGYNRPADTPSYSRLTIDTDAQGGEIGPFSTIETFLRIVGDADMEFTPMKAGIDQWGAPVSGGTAIALGVDNGDPTNDFMVDFSEAGGTISNLTLAHFQNVDAMYGNGTDAAPVRVNVEIDENQIVASSSAGLVSRDVQVYVATVIDDTAQFWTSRVTEDLQTLGLRGNYEDTITFGNTERGVDFLMEVAYNKFDGYAVGTVVADFARSGADAVFNIVGLSTLPAGEMQMVAGINVTDAVSLVINVEGGDTLIHSLVGADVDSLTLTADADLTLHDQLMSGVESVDASGVDGTLTMTMDAPADPGFTFVGAAGATELTIKDADAGDIASISGAGDISLIIDGDVNLTETTVTNVTSVTLESGSEFVITMDQADDIGAANFAVAEGDAADLVLEGLNDQVFALANYDVEGTLSISLTLAEVPEVILNALTDLTGISSLIIPKGTTLYMTAAQFQQLDDEGTITGDLLTGEGGSLVITDVMQDDVGDAGEDLDLSFVNLMGTDPDSTVTLELAESVDLSDADIDGVNTITFGDDIMLTLGDIQQADGVEITGGADSTLKFTDIDTNPFEDIDASGFDVTTLMFTNTLTMGGNRNIDDIFGGLAGSITKVIYNGEGTVLGIDQVVDITAGTTVTDSLVFNPSEDDVELSSLTLNMLGGTEISGNLRVSTDDKVGDNGNDLIRTYLQKLTINSEGTAGNLLSGEMANIITGDVTPVSGAGGQTNNLLDLEINASQDFIVEGNVVFASNVGGDGDSIAANDIEDAVATMTVTGDADVTLGGVDLTDGDVDGLNVINNGTGTVSLTLDSADSDEDLSFTGTGDIELTVEGVVDLSDDDLSAVTQITLAEDADLILSQAQLNTLGVANLINGDTEDDLDETLAIVDFDPAVEFNVTALDEGITLVSLTLSAGGTLNPATDLTGVGSIIVPEGETLTLTAAQFQQLAGAGTITALNTDGNAGNDEITVNITDLMQADVDYDVDNTGGETDGFDLTDVDVGGGSITVTTAEDVNLDANTDLNGAAVEIVGFHLGLATEAQADGLVVTGTAASVVTFMFDITLPSIDADGYDIGTLRALATSVSGEDVEFIIDNLSSDVMLNLYEDPNDLNYVSPIFRVVTIEEGVAVPASLVFNGQDGDREVRSLTINFTGDATDRTEMEDADGNLEGSVIAGDLILDREPATGGLIATLFQKLTLNSTGVGDSNAITGDISPMAQGVINPGGSGNEDNNLLDVEINATSDFAIGGTVFFNSTDADLDEATLTVEGTADVSIGALDVSDADIDVLNIVNNGGTLTLTGASPSINANTTESIVISGDGDVMMGTVEDPEDFEDGIDSDGTLSSIDASGLTGALSIENITDVDLTDFSFVSGTGVTTVRVSFSTLDTAAVDGDTIAAADENGWNFDLSDAAAGSQLTFGAGLTFTEGDLTVDLGTGAVLYITADTDWTALDSVNITGTIVLGAGVDLVLTAAQASGLTIIADSAIVLDQDDADYVQADVPTVRVTELGTAAYDFSDILAGAQDNIDPDSMDGVLVLEASLATNDVMLNAATDLGDFAIVLDDLVDSTSTLNDDLEGQTIRFTTEAQAARDINVTNPGAGAGNEPSINVVWLFTSIADVNGVDTSNYDANVTRLMFSSTLLANEGGLVEGLFTTLPDTILRVDFGTLDDLAFLLSSTAVDRVMEISSFNTVGNLTFSDIGISPVEHLQSLTLKLGGEVTIGNIAVADVVGAPGYNPAAVTFNGITIESSRSVRTGDLLASEGFVNDNDGTAEAGENVQPINMNTVGNLSVGTDNGLDLLIVNLDTLGVSPVAGDVGFVANAAGDGAALTVGTITYESDVAASGALLDITGDNDITIAAINTADADIIALTIDATGFTAVLDPVMNMDATEGMVVDNGSVAAGTITLEEVEGNELSEVDASTFGGDINITFSQIDSNDDLATDFNGDALTTGDYEGANDAFSYMAAGGVNTIVVQQVGANIPTLAAGSTWNFDMTGADAGSTLTIDATTSLAAGSILNVELGGLGNVILNIDGNLNLSGVTLNITGGDITVGAGDTLTLSVDQVLALQVASVDIVGSGTVKVTGNADDVDGSLLGTPLKTVNVDFSGIALTAVDGMDDVLTTDDVFGVVLLGGVDDNGDDMGQSVIGSTNVDAIETADDLNNTLNGGTGNDTLTGGDDTSMVQATFNTYVVASGTDTIVGLKGDGAVSDVITASGGATANATTDGDFVATDATTNTGATVSISTGNPGADVTLDMSAAGGTSGYTLTGTNDLVVMTDAIDTLVGSAQADIINGGNWDQAMATQADVLTGNGGNDRFVFNTSVNSAATLTVLTTTPGIDREVITLVADTSDDGDEFLTITYTINNIPGIAFVDLTTVVVTDLAAVRAAVITALDAKAGIAAAAGVGAGEVVVSGDNAGSLTITGITPGGTTEAATGLDDSSWADGGLDQAQITTITVAGTPTAGDLYSVILAYVEGAGAGDDYTAMMADTSVEVAAGLDDLLPDETVVGAVAALSVVTYTDQDADNGGFVISTDTTAAFAGSGASDNGAVDYMTADVITDFVSAQDSISFGLAAGASGVNYFEAAAAADYATARTNANTAFDGTVMYYMTSTTDLNGDATADDGAGLLFVDANLDGNVDLVVLLTGGVTSASFNALDIVA